MNLNQPFCYDTDYVFLSSGANYLITFYSLRSYSMAFLTFLSRYRSKCRKYQQQVADAETGHKKMEDELAQERARAKEIETSNLKLQKQQQELFFEFSNLKDELNDREAQCTQLLDERQRAEQAFTHASMNAKQTNELKVHFLSRLQDCS